MPMGVPRTKEERRERHARLFGGEPPLRRLGLGPKYEGLGEVFWDLLPTLPLEFGLLPPMPRFLARMVMGGKAGRKA